MTRRRAWMRRLAVLTAICVLAAIVGEAKGPTRYPSYDRMQVVEDFLVEIYPQLQHEKGMLTFQTDEFNLGVRPPFYVHFMRCHPGSGVPASASPVKIQPCPGVVQLDSTNLFTARVETGPVGFPLIHQFGAFGELVTGKLDKLETKLKEDRIWKEEEMLTALQNEEPRFPPERREDFLRSVGSRLQVIHRFSGCSLTPEQAKFIVNSSGSPSERGLVWYIPGTYRAGGRTNICSATFEPFEGNLIAIYESP